MLASIIVPINLAFAAANRGRQALRRGRASVVARRIATDVLTGVARAPRRGRASVVARRIATDVLTGVAGAPRCGRASVVARIARALVVALLSAACGGPAEPELVERFRLACARLAAEAAEAGTPIVTGSDGWYFAAGEVAALGSEAAGSDRAVAAIAAEAERLGRDGIELVVAPVPPKGVVYPDRLAPALDVPIPVRRLDATLQDVYRDLRARGVRVVDLTEAFLRDRFHHEGPLYCRQDSHWSGVGCVAAAEIIGAAVRELAVLEEAPAQPYGLAWFTTPIRGDLWRHLPQPPPREEIRVRGVVAPEDPLLAPVARNGDAPVAVVGDSHALVFHGGEPHHARGAGVADQLAFELRQPVALHADDGSDPSGDAENEPPSRATAALHADGSSPSGDPWRLPPTGKRTRVVIWIFAAARLLGGA